MIDWKECTLGDILTFQRGHDLPKKNMTGEGYPVAGSNGIIGFHNEYTTEAPAITIGRSGNVGNPYIYYEKIWAHNTTLYIKEYKNSDPEFIYYLLKIMNLGSHAGGSAVPTLNRNHIHPLPVKVPTNIVEQKKIASVLKLFDDKIANNDKINRNLSDQARALYKSIFVDFDDQELEDENETIVGFIPKGWKIYNLSDFLPVITGKKNANVSSKEGEYPFFSCSKDISWTDNYSFDGNAILVAGNGDFNVKFYNGKFEAYQRTYVLIPNNSRYTAWLYYAIDFYLKIITSAARGSVIRFITKGNLEDFKFAGPNDLNSLDVIDIFSQINESIEENRQENMKLSELRDILLARLMSGELDVSDLKK